MSSSNTNEETQNILQDIHQTIETMNKDLDTFDSQKILDSSANANTSQYNNQICSTLSTIPDVDQNHVVTQSTATETKKQSEISTPICKSPFLSFTDLLGEIVSVYELFVLFLILPFLITCSQNVFLILLWLGILSKYIPEFLFQYVFSIANKSDYWFRKKNPVVFQWAQRPSNTSNSKRCGIFPSETPLKNKSVSPSGHVFTISVIAFYMLFKFTKFFKILPNSKQITLISLLMVFVVIIANIQTYNKCQSFAQVVFGAVLGSFWAIGVYFAIEEIVKLSARIQADEEKFMILFSND